MTRLVAGILWFVLGLMVGGAAWASPPELWERPSAEAERVGVVVVATGAEVEDVEEALTSKWKGTNTTVVKEGAIDSTVGQATVEQMEAMREEGAEKFFFEGMEAAREHLRQTLEGKLAITRPWMGDERAAKALFDTGIFLVRAYLDLGEEAEARRWMEKLVEALPAHRPEGDAYPPAIVELWQQVSTDMEAGETSLELSASLRAPNCRVEINGQEVDRQRLAVAPNRSYVLVHECGDDGKRRARWVSAGKGERRAVEAFYAGLEAEALEESLDVIASRRDLDAVVYVGPASCDGGAICLGVYRRGLTLRALDEGGVDEAWTQVSAP